MVYGEEELTYGELNERANQLGHYLRRVGSRAGSAGGDLRGAELEMVVGMLGILKAGGAYVPLDPDIRWSGWATWWRMRSGGGADAEGG